MIPSSLTTRRHTPEIVVALRGPPAAARCAARGAAGDLSQRPPAFVRGTPGLLDRATHARDLLHEVVEPGLDLIADATAVLGQIQPTPDSTDDRTQTGGHQNPRAFVHSPPPSTSGCCAADASPHD